MSSSTVVGRDYNGQNRTTNAAPEPKVQRPAERQLDLAVRPTPQRVRKEGPRAIACMPRRTVVGTKPVRSRFSRLTGDIDMTDNDALVELHTALIDTCNGYDEALKDAQKPDIVALFQRAKLLHEKAHANIHAILSARGVAPDD
jgi:hypothetical protein